MPDLLERLKVALADRYAIEKEIGRGGMATVYLAEDLKHHRKVAIKVLHPELAVTLAADRFLNEIQIAAGLNHPHILSLIDSGEADGLPYYVMPYVEGESLRDRLDREGELPVEEAVRIAVEVADGLEHAHERGVVHRDVKPGNILLSGRHAVVADFGIARAVTAAQEGRMTGTGLGVGTPLYASPEQATAAETLDGRTDVYSLGCVLYEMLTGEVPLTAATPQAVQARRLAETPAPIHAQRETVPPLLDQVVAKALAKRPADRWESAEAFGQALMTATMDATPVARAELAHVLGQEAVARRTGMPLWWVTTGAVVVIGALGVWFLGSRMSSVRGGAGDAAGRAVHSIETKLNLEGRFGDDLGFATGSFAISPDGDYLAYCSRDDEAGVARLWLANLSVPGTRHRALASGSFCNWVRWTPSGDRVLFFADIAGRMDYYAAPRLGGGVRPFIECPYRDSAGKYLFDVRKSRLSPDGSRIAHFKNPDTFLRVVPTETCDLTYADSIHVAGDYQGIWFYGWSPTGDRLFLETSQNVGQTTFWTIGIDRNDQKAVASTGDAYYPAYWPLPGQFIYFGSGVPSGHRRVMRVEITDTGEVKGEPEPLPHFEQNPVNWFSISRDGRTAVVARQVVRYRIVRIARQEGNGPEEVSIEPVLDTVSGFAAFRVSRDGKWVAYQSSSEAGTDLLKVPIAGGDPIRLTSTGLVDRGEWPAWSPGDSMVAFSGWWADTLRLWLVKADGRISGYVRDVRTNYEYPELSWEGEDLFYYRGDYSGTEVLRDLTIEHGEWSAGEWRPTAKGAPPSRQFLAEAARELLSDSLSEWRYSSVIGSPDDNRFVGICSSEEGAYWCVVSREDFSRRLLIAVDPDEMPLGWTGDGHSLYWQSGSDIYVWPLDGGEKKLVLTLPTGMRWVQYGSVAGSVCQPRLGEQGVELVCAVDETVTDLFLVENFDPDLE